MNEGCYPSILKRIPVILNLLLIILDLLPHRTLLVCQPLEFAFHDPHLILQHPPSLDDVCRA